MTRQEIETLTRRYMDAFMNGNVDDAAEYMARDAEGQFPGFDEDGSYGFVTLFTGPEGYAQSIQNIHNSFPDFGGKIDELIVTENKAVIRYTVGGTFERDFLDLQATGKHFEYVAIDLIHFEDGKIVKTWTVWDELRGWQQAGVLPEWSLSYASGWEGLQ